MYLLKLFTLILFCSTILFANDYLDSLNISKVKKLIEKEEQIAFAYKEYILKKGKNATSINDLKELDSFPSDFNADNYFGNNIAFSTEAFTLISFPISNRKILKSNINDYYFSDKYRKYTRAPIDISNPNVKIILSSKEKLIYNLQSKITTNKTSAKSKTIDGGYYLDSNSILHWYDKDDNYKFSFNKDLLLDESVNIFDEDGTTSSEYKILVKDVIYTGIIILHKDGDKAVEYIGNNIDNVKETNVVNVDYSDLMLLSNTSAGMLINGDIYSWGNNVNRSVGINKGSDSVITTPVRLKAKVYDDTLTDSVDTSTFYGMKYFSSPLRPKFKEFFSSVKSGTCGITREGALYCGGTTGNNYSFGKYFNHVDTVRNGEMLYRSTFFDGKSVNLDSENKVLANKAKKIFANDTLWTILDEDGYVYRWGYDTGNGFSGNGFSTFNNTPINVNKNPEKIEKIKDIKFSDTNITSTTSLGHRKIAALSKSGDIYIWGIDKESGTTTCTEIWDGITYNLCTPTKISSNNSTMPTNSSLIFDTIRGGTDAFIAKTNSGVFYKITHHKNEKIQVDEVDDLIFAESDYNENKDSLGTIIDVDFSRKKTELPISLPTTSTSKGIVWINSENELKGDYYPSVDTDKNIFDTAISKIQWKKIKVINENNTMCGINTDNQMYCWGDVYSSVDGVRTYILPIFNTNLYELAKDYLVLNSGTSSTFKIKYPTYIGGFNYDFIFK